MYGKPRREGGVRGKLRAQERKTNVSPGAAAPGRSGGAANRCLTAAGAPNAGRRDSGPAGRSDCPPASRGPGLRSPGSGGDRETLRFRHCCPRLREGGGGERARLPLLPAPAPLVMHFLRPRIPFVLKFRIRPRRAAGGRGAPLAAGIPEWAAVPARSPGGAVAFPAGRCSWHPSAPLLLPTLSRACSAARKHSSRRWPPGCQRSATATAGGSVGFPLGGARERRVRDSLLPPACCVASRKPRLPVSMRKRKET